jgi:putative ABC transport system permease protein
MRPVSSDYASVFSIPIVRGRRGRLFTDHDTAKTGSVAVISEAMAKRYWPDKNPIGERIIVDKYVGPDFAAPAREVLGVVRDMRDMKLSKEPGPMIYVPQAQVPRGMTGIDIGVLPITWAVRSSVEPYLLSTGIQRALKEASGGLPVARIRSMEDVVRHSTVRSDFTAVLLTAFAGASLLLAALGVYGLIVFSVQERQHEIGIRLALGAKPYQVRNMVLSQGMRLAVSGVLVGTLAGIAVARFMEALVYGVKPIDLTVTVVSALTLCLVGALASYISAYWASRLDPAKTLRSG